MEVTNMITQKFKTERTHALDDIIMTHPTSEHDMPYDGPLQTNTNDGPKLFNGGCLQGRKHTAGDKHGINLPLPPVVGSDRDVWVPVLEAVHQVVLHCKGMPVCARLELIIGINQYHEGVLLLLVSPEESPKVQEESFPGITH